MELTLNIYEGSKVVKTYKANTIDLEYGLVEDLISIVDFDKLDNTMELGKMIIKVLPLIKPFLINIFDGLTEEEVRHTRILEMKDIFIEIYNYILELIDQLNDGETKN